MKRVMKQAGLRPRPLRSGTLLAGLLLSLSALFPVAADTLTFTVTATVVAPTCSVAPDSVNLDIPMPDIDGAQLDSMGKTSPTLFSIKLEKCGSNTSAKLTFSSNTADGQGNFHPDKAGDKLRGFLLALTDQHSVRIKLGDEVVRPLAEGNNTLQFGVQAIRDTSQPLVPGDFTAAATATIAYM